MLILLRLARGSKGFQFSLKKDDSIEAFLIFGRKTLYTLAVLLAFVLMPKYFDYKKIILKVCMHQHLRMDQIFSQVKKYLGREVALSVLYKHIQELLALGKLKEVLVLKGKSYYETTIDHHAHLVDEEQGQIRDLPFPLIADSFLPEDFKVSEMQLTIYGTFSSKKTA